MKVLVVDDERLARERLARLISGIEGYEVVGDAASGSEAVRKTLDLEPDIVLMDIRMPGMDGLAAGKEIGKLTAPPAIVYCTAYGEHALEAYAIPAAGYLLKPVRREALQEMLQKVARSNRAQLEEQRIQRKGPQRARTHISARTRRGIELVPLDDVCFFVADHKYVTVRHEGGELLIDDTLRELEEEFGDRLVRIHRNALVMTDHLEGLERDIRGHYLVRMRGVDQRLEVSRRHVPDLRRLVQSI